MTAWPAAAIILAHLLTPCRAMEMTGRAGHGLIGYGIPMYEVSGPLLHCFHQSISPQTETTAAAHLSVVVSFSPVLEPSQLLYGHDNAGRRSDD